MLLRSMAEEDSSCTSSSWLSRKTVQRDAEPRGSLELFTKDFLLSDSQCIKEFEFTTIQR